jgi:hypothetical protein
VSGLGGGAARVAAAGLALSLAVIVPAAAQAPPGGVALSANPVQGASVTFRWPAGTGAARVGIYSQLGALVAGYTIAADTGALTWDLRTSDGTAVANGAYIVVVTRGDGARYRRRVLVAR